MRQPDFRFAASASLPREYLFLLIFSVMLLLAQQVRGADTSVFVAKAQEKKLVDTLEALGTLKANESVTISAQTTEIVTDVKFTDGQRVNKGDVLADMSSAEEQALLEEAEATLREADDQLKRASPLAERGFNSEALLSERKRNYETALAQLAAAKSRVDDRRITAPFSGVVGLRNISVGALVSPGTVITTIDDDSVMKLDFTIPATYLAAIKVGLPIRATARAFGDKVFDGKVTAIDSRVDAITRSITVRAIIPNPDGILKAGILMTVEIMKNERQAIVVPERAIIARGANAFVYVVDPKSQAPKIEKKDVSLGARAEGEVEILKGIDPNDYVVTDGSLRVRPGQVVSIAAISTGDEPLTELLDAKKKSDNPS